LNADDDVNDIPGPVDHRHVGQAWGRCERRRPLPQAPQSCSWAGTAPTRWSRRGERRIPFRHNRPNAPQIDACLTCAAETASRPSKRGAHDM